MSIMSVPYIPGAKWGRRNRAWKSGEGVWGRSREGVGVKGVRVKSVRVKGVGIKAWVIFLYGDKFNLVY